MKKRLSTVLIALLLILCISLPALAYTSNRTLDLVTDAAAILNESDAAYLNSEAERITSLYDCEVIIVTVDSLDGYYVEDFSQAVFETYQYGCGEERSCVMLLLSYYDRKYDILAYGFGNEVFTDARKDILVEHIVPCLSEDRWYDAFDLYLKICEDFLYATTNGLEHGEYDAPQFSLLKLLVTLALSAIPALIVILSMRKKMKTAVKQSNANAYIAENGINITYWDDHYVRSNVRRVAKSSGSGGGKTSVNSGGFSHRSGDF